MKARIGFIEDDATILRLVAKRLTSLDYDLHCFETADAAWEDFSKSQLDLYIVDRMVPGTLSGIELCEKMRKQSPAVPLLILSALSEGGDRIEGLRAGADDYLTKPFEMEELCLRVEALLKRTKRILASSAPLQVSQVQLGQRIVDFDRFEVISATGVTALSSKECLLLKLLIEREGRVVTRDEILNELWDYRLFPSSRTVDNFIVRLRRLLEEDPGQPKYIHSVRGMGYKFTLQ